MITKWRQVTNTRVRKQTFASPLEAPSAHSQSWPPSFPSKVSTILTFSHFLAACVFYLTLCQNLSTCGFRKASALIPSLGLSWLKSVLMWLPQECVQMQGCCVLHFNIGLEERLRRRVWPEAWFLTGCRRSLLAGSGLRTGLGALVAIIQAAPGTWR